MNTYATTIAGGTEYGRDWRAKSPDALARRLYGEHASVIYRRHTDKQGRTVEWWEVTRPTVPGDWSSWEWVDDIFIA
jgi:hypothetical protein